MNLLPNFPVETWLLLLALLGLVMLYVFLLFYSCIPLFFKLQRGKEGALKFPRFLESNEHLQDKSLPKALVFLGYFF